MSNPTNFVTRAQWGSSFNYSNNTRMPSTSKGVALHWEGPKMGAFSHDKCDDKVRSIETFHVKTRGWAGIAYNALVCPHGHIYEGRGMRYRSAANGDVPKNAAWFAVCYLGGKGDPFTDAAKAALIRAVQWLRADGGAGSKVIGHRDVTSTECPGSTIQAWLERTNFSTGGSTPPAPKQVAVWDLPSTWAIGSTGAVVTKLGQRLVIWAKHLGLPAPYKVGPGPEFTETDRDAVAAFQRAQGWTGDDADGYPGAETFKRLAATPQPDPEPTTGPVVTSASLNAGSYNATGAKTYKARTDRYVNRRLRQLVDVLNFQEVGNGLNRPGKPNARMRARLDKGFGDTYRRHIGSDGRYNYSNRGSVKPIRSGVITASKTAWFRGDNKQASYLVFEKNGVRGMDVSFHLENESGPVADRKRVDQMLSILKQALKIATAEGVDIRNILFVGDTNSEGMVADAMAAARWRNVATGTEYENARTFTGWDGRSSKRFDYGFVYQHASPATLVTVDADTDVSDHAELVIRRTLTAK